MRDPKREPAVGDVLMKPKRLGKHVTTWARRVVVLAQPFFPIRGSGTSTIWGEVLFREYLVAEQHEATSETITELGYKLSSMAVWRRWAKNAEVV